MRTRAAIGNQITEGVIWKQLLFFFFPILMGTLFQQLYNTADTVIVGRFVGTQALAAVGGSTGQLVNLVVNFFVGLSSGATVIIARYYGAQHKRHLNDTLHTAIALSFVGDIGIGIIGFIGAPWILQWMQTPTDVIAESTSYLRIYFAGIVFLFVYNIGSGILRAVGDSKRPLYFLIICCFLNIGLDILFVVVLHLGVKGAALATVIAQAVSAVLVMLSLMQSNDIYLFITTEKNQIPQIAIIFHHYHWIARRFSICHVWFIQYYHSNLFEYIRNRNRSGAYSLCKN